MKVVPVAKMKVVPIASRGRLAVEAGAWMSQMLLNLMSGANGLACHPTGGVHLAVL
jgi:hypothetical protein